MTISSPVLLHDVDVGGERVDVLLANGRIAAIAAQLSAPQHAERIEGHGGALVPGLHDHHVHLLAVAAAARSVDVSALDAAEFARALRVADASLPAGSWMRVVGHHEAHTGVLDRAGLDAIVATRPATASSATSTAT